MAEAEVNLAVGAPGVDASATSCRLEKIEQVIEEMTRRWIRLHRAGDWRAVFAKTYLCTTEKLLEATRRPGIFTDTAWVVSIDCHFAQRYFTAEDLWEDGGNCPWPWRIAFQSARQKRTLVFQDVLLGMNAHINYDLPYSLDATIPADATPNEIETYRRDNDQLNHTLVSIINLIQEEIAEDYDPGIDIIDLVLGKGDEQGGSRMIRIWRARSWAHFLLLREARDDPLARARVEKLIEHTACEYALMLLEIQRAIPVLYWPNRLYRDSLNWLVRRRRSVRV
jgi:hypothetical protein